MGDRNKLKSNIAGLLRKMFDLQYGGSPGTKFRWMQGFTDGYIQACIDLGSIDESDVLLMIQNERKQFLEGAAPSESSHKRAA